MSRHLAAGAVLLLAAAAGVLKVRSVDAFWHLAAGRWMLEHRALPRLDPFRFTSHDVAWVDHEWGFQVIAAAVERLGGLDALVVLRAGVMVLLAGLLLGVLARQGVPPAPAALVVALAVAGLRSRFLLRPELASLVALALLLLLLRRLRHGGRQPAASVALVALVAAWANLHPGVLVAPVVTGLSLVGAWWEGRRRGGAGAAGGPTLLGAGGLTAGALLAIAVNPWGFEVFAVPWRIARALAGLPVVNPDWAPLWKDPQPLFLAGLAALLILLGVTWRQLGRIDLPGTLVAAALLALAVSAARHQGMVWIAGALLAGDCLGALAREGRLAAAWGERRAALAGALVALAAALWFVRAPASGPWGTGHEPGLGVAPGLFPERALAELGRWEPVGNLYNSPAFGGYLLWRLFPPRQVFWDTRNEVNPGLLREIVAARAGSGPWENLLAHHRIDGALVGYEERLRPVVTPAAEPGGKPTVEHVASSALLFPSERFALVHWDDVSMLFLARTAERAPLFPGREYLYVQPEDWRNLLTRAARDPALRGAAAAELRRKLREDPECQRAAALLRALERDSRAAPSPLGRGPG